MFRIYFIFFAVSIFVGAQRLQAVEPSNVVLNPFVTWEQPELENQNDRMSALVTVRGHSKPGTKINLASGTITVDKQNNIKSLSSEEVAGGQTQTVADQDGNFSIKLHLPYGDVQVPLHVILPDRKPQNFILNMTVTKDHVFIFGAAEKLIAHKLKLSVGPILDTYFATQTSSLAINTSFTTTALSGRADSEYVFHKNYYLIASIVPLHYQVDSASSNFSILSKSFNDFRFSIGVGRPISTQWIRSVAMDAELIYQNEKTPIFTRASTPGTLDLTVGNVSEFRGGLRGHYKLTPKLTASARTGFIYGRVTAEKFSTNAHMLGGYLDTAAECKIGGPLSGIFGINIEYGSIPYRTVDLIQNVDVNGKLTRLLFTLVASGQYSF